MSFTKLHNKLIRSTVWNKPNHMRITWITMLALADRDGLVLSSIPGLATLARLTVDEIEESLEDFRKPDKYSQSTIDEGRRIRDVEGGWELITYEIHRRMFSADERREKDAARKRRIRSGVSAGVRKSPPSPHIADTDTDTDADTEADTKAEAVGGDGKPPDKPKAPKKATRTKSIAHQMPADWSPTDAHISFAKEHTEIEMDLEVVKFKGHWDSKPLKSWNGAFSKWLAQTVTYAKRDAKASGGRRLGVTPIQPAKSGRTPTQFAAELEQERIRSGQ